MTNPTPLVSDTTIFQMLESVLINDEVVPVMDAHRVMLALRDRYEQERCVLIVDLELAMKSGTSGQLQTLIETEQKLIDLLQHAQHEEP